MFFLHVLLVIAEQLGDSIADSRAEAFEEALFQGQGESRLPGKGVYIFRRLHMQILPYESVIERRRFFCGGGGLVYFPAKTLPAPARLKTSSAKLPARGMYSSITTRNRSRSAGRFNCTNTSFCAS